MEVDTTKARGHIICEEDLHFSEELCKLYHLCIGFNQDPNNPKDYKFTHEYVEDFCTFPTISTLAIKVFLHKIFQSPGMPRLQVQQLLHGEQIVEVHDSIQPGSTVKCSAVIDDIADKGKGMLITVRIDLKDSESEKLYSRCYMKWYVKGAGGFGDKGILDLRVPSIPIREADKTIDIWLDKNLATVYRLWGDTNPLHIDPKAAKEVGFDKPILHGLCTYGIVTRVVYDEYCYGDVEMIKNVSARFVSYVYPGETIKVNLYEEGSQIFFSAMTLERETVVITGVVGLRPLARI